MIKNYFRTAWRNLGRNKLHSFINVTGLSIGMAVSMMIGLWIYDEVSFDKNFEHYNRIAQVLQNVTNNGEVQTWTRVPYPLAEELRKDYGSDFKHIAMAVDLGDHIISVGEKRVKSKGVFFEKEAPDIFSFTMLRGDRNGLSDPSSVMISESAAKSYFGSEDPVGKTIKVDQQPPLKITGVYEDFPFNSIFAGLNFVGPWDFFYKNNDLKSMEDPWRPNFAMLFVQLNDHAEFDKVSIRIKDAKLKRVGPQLAKKKPALFLQPMAKSHLYAEFKNGINIGGDIQYVWMFGLIGVFVLMLACINFMNLSTASSAGRAKEVGIRKTIGCLRSQLVFQFFNESILTVFFAFALSLLFVQLTLPFFNAVGDKQMRVPWNNYFFWASGICFVIITAIAAGSYPAFYLSSFQPVKVLKGTFKAGRFASLPRKVLVVLQFTVSVTLIIGTIIVYRQIEFVKDRPVGYIREGLISVPTTGPSIHDHFNALKDELMGTGEILSVAESESPTTAVYNSTSGLSWESKDPNLSVDFAVINASYDYGKTIGWKIKEGRDFSREYSSDTSAFILNEAAAHFMGLENPIGGVVTWWGQKFVVIGIVNNMIMNSPYDEVSPAIYHLLNYPGNLAILKVKPSGKVEETIARIAPIFKRYSPDQPFEYNFVDEEYAKKFTNEERVSRLAGFFALLAIAISCLGLFGLTSFVAEQRKKEIGVRKVLGASVANVWNMLSRDFVMLVIISLIIAVPLSDYFMNSWLENYHYRVNISWWIFVAAGIGSLGITILVVSIQTIKAAVANPVKSLRID
jgi:putative ABC transport system permease protein